MGSTKEALAQLQAKYGLTVPTVELPQTNQSAALGNSGSAQNTLNNMQNVYTPSAVNNAFTAPQTPTGQALSKLQVKYGIVNEDGSTPLIKAQRQIKTPAVNLTTGNKIADSQASANRYLRPANNVEQFTNQEFTPDTYNPETNKVTIPEAKDTRFKGTLPFIQPETKTTEEITAEKLIPQWRKEVMAYTGQNFDYKEPEDDRNVVQKTIDYAKELHGNPQLQEAYLKKIDASIVLDEEDYKAYLAIEQNLGLGKANEFYESIKQDRLKKQAEEMAAERKAYAQEHPITGTINYLGDTAVGAISSIPLMIENTMSEVTGLKPVEQYSALNQLTRAAEGGREGIQQGVKDTFGIENGTNAAAVADFLTGTGLSIISTMARSAALGPVAGGVEAGLSAMASAYNENIDKGAKGLNSMLGALGQGIAEMFFEKYSLESLDSLKAVPTENMSDFFKNILKQSFTEGSEELFTDWANAITDTIIMGDYSSVKQSIANYVAVGMSETDAINQAISDVLKESMLSFAGGALSGGVTGGVTSAINLVANKANNNQNKGNAQLTYDPVMVEQALTNLGLKLNQNTETDPNTVQGLPAYGTTDVNRQAQFRAAERIAKNFNTQLVVQKLENGATGEYRDGVIYIDPDTTNPVMSVLAHELTHHIESAKQYEKLDKLITKYISEDMGIDLNTMKQAIIDEYAQGGFELDDAGAQRELMAKFVENSLFQDEAAIQRLLREDRNLFQTIYEWISDTIKMVKGTNEERTLIQAQRLFENALRSSELDINNTSESAQKSYGANFNALAERYNQEIANNDLAAANKTVAEAAAEAGYPIRAYHGTGRADRVGNVFRSDRATSGPMAFFTDNYDIAENYSRNKKDTSIDLDEDYDNLNTRFKIQTSRGEKSIDELWNNLSYPAQNAIRTMAGHVYYDDDGNIAYDESINDGQMDLGYAIKQYKGNVIRALEDRWLDGGTLFGEEGKFLDVLKLSGITDALYSRYQNEPIYKDPYYRDEKVYDVFLGITKPFDTSTVNQNFITDFEQWLSDNPDKVELGKRGSFDNWNKNDVTPDEVIERLKSDVENGTTYTWTSIPDYLTEYLKEKGYNGIKDLGGKNSSLSHTVWIPFSSEQIKSAETVTYDDNGNVIPLSERFNRNEVDIRKSYGRSFNQLASDVQNGIKYLPKAENIVNRTNNVPGKDNTGMNLTNDQQNNLINTKAVDENGNAIKVLHGSPNEDIDTFDIDKAGQNTNNPQDKAIWFTDNADWADEFSYERLENPSTSLLNTKGKKGTVYEAYLNMQNPFDLRNITEDMRQLMFNNQPFYTDYNKFNTAIDEYISANNHQGIKTFIDYNVLKEAGYDGIIARMDPQREGLEYGVFSSNQIVKANTNTKQQQYEAYKEDIANGFAKAANYPELNNKDIANAVSEVQESKVKKLPTAEEVGVKQKTKAETGKEYSAYMYHGRGKNRNEIYMNTKYPVAGEGKYYAFTEDGAKFYGDNVTVEKVELKNPLVIRDDNDWRKITNEAGWKYINFGPSDEENIQNIKNLKQLVLDKGHDGIIVQYEDNIKGDFNSATDGLIKTIDRIFGGDQAVVYTDEVRKLPKAEEIIAGKNTEDTKTEVNAVESNEDIRNRLPSKARNYLSRVESKLTNNIAYALGASRFADRTQLRNTVKSVSEEYLQTGTISQESQDKLFNEAYDQARVNDEYWLNQNKAVGPELSKITFKIDDNTLNDFADSEVWLKDAKKYIKVGDSGSNIDTVYEELSTRHPELFPTDIANKADQIDRIVKVAKSLKTTERTLNDYYGQDSKTYKEWAKRDFESAINNSISELNLVKRYSDEALQKTAEEHQITAEDVQKAYQSIRDLRKAAEKAVSKNLLTEADTSMVGKLLRGEAILEDVDKKKYNYNGIKEVYEAKLAYEKVNKVIQKFNAMRKENLRKEADTYLENAQSWKDKSAGWKYSRETMERNMRDIIPDRAEADKVNEYLFKPVHDSEADSTRFKNEHRATIKDLNLSRDVAKGNTVSESYAVQFVGEAEDNLQTIIDNNLTERDGMSAQEWESTLNKFWAENPNLDKNKIEDAVQTFREEYDAIRDQMNEVLIRNGYEPVPYRRGYFPHFEAGNEDSLFAKFKEAFGVDAQAAMLPTEINGRTASFKPGKAWFGNALERKGIHTDYDAVLGYDNYIRGAADVIYQTDNIQRLRQFTQQARYRTSDKAIQEEIDNIRANKNLNESEKDAKIAEIYAEAADRKFSLSNLVVELDEYTNLLANKKSKADRNMEALFGRKIYEIAKKMEGRVASNMIAFNPGSWLTNFIPITQAWTQVDSQSLLRGMWDTLRNMNSTDGFVDTSNYLTARFGSDSLIKDYENAKTKAGKVYGKIVDKASGGMDIVDNFTSEAIVRARYYQNLNEGMSQQAAIDDADAFAAGLQAARSKGSMPTIFGATNPIYKLATQFQLEANNELSWLFKDIPDDLKKKGISALISGLIKFLIGTYIYDDVYEFIVGRRPALDPLGILNNTVGNFTGYELPNMLDATSDLIAGREVQFKKQKPKTSDALAELAEDVGGNIPGVTIVTGGGRLPISSALPDMTKIVPAITDDDRDAKNRATVIGKELAKPIAYLAMPGAGGQLKKIAEGHTALRKGGSYTVNKEGNDILQYPIFEDTLADDAAAFAKTTLFGKSSTRNAREWVDNGFNSLTDRQTQLYKDLQDNDTTDRAAWDFVNGYRYTKKESEDDDSTNYKKRKYIEESDLTDSQKAVAYKDVYLDSDDKQNDVLTKLESSGEDMGKVYNVLTGLKDDNTLEEGKAKAQRNRVLQSDLSDEAKKTVYYELLLDKDDSQREVIDKLSKEDSGELIDVMAGIKDNNTKKGKAEKNRKTVLNSNLSDKAKKQIYVDLLLDKDDSQKAVIKELESMKEKPGAIVTTMCAIKDSEDSEEKFNAILDSKLSDEAKEYVYLNTCVTKDNREAAAEDINTAKSAGLSFEEYISFKSISSNAKEKDGVSKKEQILDLIDSYNIGNNQKDMLYYISGYKESKINEAPWKSGPKYLELPGASYFKPEYESPKYLKAP